MDHELLDVIRTANREFQEFIDQVTQNGAKMVETRGALRRLEKLNHRLKEVSGHLAASSKSAESKSQAEYEILKYRETLKNLRHVMQTLQISLLAEKARLDNVRANMQAARAWATSLREIS